VGVRLKSGKWTGISWLKKLPVEHGNKVSGFIKNKKVVEQLRDY
jgi:hypothetical protein